MCNREIQVKDRTPKFLALVTAVFFGTLVFMLFKPIPGANRDIVNIMLGVLGSTFGGIVADYDASTEGSQAKSGSEAKSALIAQAAPLDGAR